MSKSDPSHINTDKVSSAIVTAEMAQTAHLSIATNVVNASISVQAKADLSQPDDTLMSKPQIVDQTPTQGITDYVTINGDSVTTLANKFKITPDTIKWANNLTTDTLSPGTTLTIPAISGVVYTIKAGDTAQSLAIKYKTDANRVISYNNLELTGLKDGQKIVLPAGVLPDAEKPGYVAPRAFASGYSDAVVSNVVTTNAGNLYDFGYCTWYVYNRRVEMGLLPPGSNWGNANSWDNIAANDPRFTISAIPHVGDIAQNDNMSYWGHVAIVEDVSADGTQIKFSDMNNLAGWGRVGYSNWTPVSKFPKYIHSN